MNEYGALGFYFIFGMVSGFLAVNGIYLMIQALVLVCVSVSILRYEKGVYGLYHSGYQFALTGVMWGIGAGLVIKMIGGLV